MSYGGSDASPVTGMHGSGHGPWLARHNLGPVCVSLFTAPTHQMRRWLICDLFIPKFQYYNRT